MKAVRFNATTGLGALATLVVASANMISASDAKYRLLSIRFVANWNNIEVGDDGALMFGIAHGDYTAVEIEECLEATTSISQGDKIANEKADRLVRILGIFPSAPGAAAGGPQELSYNDGRAQTVKLNWEIPIGKTVSFWGYNTSDDQYTTGSNLVMLGSANIRYA